MSNRHLCSNLDLDMVEPLIFETMEDILIPPMKIVHIPNNTGHNLGSSKTRTPTQAAMAKQVVLDYLETVGNDITVYIDGSALQNPGPCGSGAAVFWNGHGYDPTIHSSPVSPISSSYHAELGGIDLALDILNNSIYSKPVHILIDCQSALETATSTNMSKNHAALQRKIKHKNSHLLKQVKQLDISWIGGHIDLLGNDLADRAAKDAALLASKYPHLCKYMTLSPKEASTIIKSGVLHTWIKRCKTLHSDSHLLPAPSLSQCISLVPRNAEVKLNRIKLQHHKLRDHMHKIMPHAYTTAECSCGEDRQTVEHVLLHCRQHTVHRDTLIGKIELSFRKNSVHIFHRKFNLDTLLIPKYSVQINKDIHAAVASFLIATELDI